MKRDTLLRMAASCGWRPLVRLLLRLGADPDARDLRVVTVQAVDENGEPAGSPRTVQRWMTALMHGVLGRHQPVARALLAAGADVNGRDGDGSTPLMHAVSVDDAGMVRLLLEAGADLEARDASGRTALDRAGQFGAAAAETELRRAGARE